MIFFRGRLQPGMVDPPRSSVSIRFDWPGDDKKVREADWNDAILAVDDWRPKPLGSTGWSHRRWWDSKEVRIDLTGKAMFDWVGKTIRRQGVFVPSGQPMMALSIALADAYWEIARNIRMKDLGIVKVEFENGPHEALTFQDHLGRRVHMVFGGGIGRLMIDGVIVGQFDDSARASAYLAEHLNTGKFPVTDYIRPLAP